MVESALYHNNYFFMVESALYHTKYIVFMVESALYHNKYIVGVTYAWFGFALSCI